VEMDAEPCRAALNFVKAELARYMM
jgi:hypothetical protein